MATLAEWLQGARPRTLPAAVSPVLVGTGAAAAIHRADLANAVLALAVAVCLQVGVNYANDYSDGVRGTDARRVGPVRLVGQGLARPGDVRLAAILSLFMGAVIGLALCALSGQMWLVLVGAAAIVAAWLYTGGSSPYGYKGLGEVMVFIFFGLVATLGTQLTQAGRVSPAGVFGAVGMGALASAILVANNLRDIPTDRESGKQTLAVRLGDARTRLMWQGLVAAAYLCVLITAIWHWPALIALLSIPLAWQPWRDLRAGARGRDLVPVLGATGRLQLGYAVLLTLGLVIAGAITR